jgi:hypothetical protein
MIKRHRGELNRPGCCAARDQIGPGLHLKERPWPGQDFASRLFKEYHMPKLGQPGHYFSEGCPAIVSLSAVPIPGHSYQNLRLDLCEAIKHTTTGKFRGTVGQIAPMLAVARNAITVSTRFGM